MSIYYYFVVVFAHNSWINFPFLLYIHTVRTNVFNEFHRSTKSLICLSTVETQQQQQLGVASCKYFVLYGCLSTKLCMERGKDTPCLYVLDCANEWDTFFLFVLLLCLMFAYVLRFSCCFFLPTCNQVAHVGLEKRVNIT